MANATLDINQNVKVTHEFASTGGTEDPFAASVRGMEAVISKLEEVSKKFAGNFDNLGKTTTREDDSNASKPRPTRAQEGRSSTISGSSLAENSLITAINKLEQTLSKISSPTPTATKLTPEQITETGIARVAVKEAMNNEAMRSFSEKSQAGISKAQQLSDIQLNKTTALNQSKLDYQEASNQNKLDLLSATLERKKQDRQEQEEQRKLSSWGKIAKGMAIGGITAGIYQSYSFGSSAGSEAGVLNVGASDYSSFMISQYNRQLDAKYSIANTAISSGSMAIGSALVATGNPVGLVAGLGVMGAGAVGNYFLGKSGAEDKAQNELAMNEDIKAWRLQSMGMSKPDFNKQLTTGGYLSGVQSIMRSSPDYAMWNVNTEEVLRSARRDVMGGKTDRQMADYSVAVQRDAMRYGVSHADLSRVASNTAAVLGTNTDDALARIRNNYNMYGGDPIANQIKINSLVTGASINPAQAESIVNRWQYNEAMLQNKVNDQTVSPMNRFKSSLLATIYKNMTGVDIDSAQAKQNYQREGRTKNGSVNPAYLIYEQAMGLRGQNVWASGAGENKGMPNNNYSPTLDPASMSAFGKSMADALADTILKVQIVDDKFYQSPFENAPVSQLKGSGKTQNTSAQQISNLRNLVTSNPSNTRYEIDGKAVTKDAFLKHYGMR